MDLMSRDTLIIIGCLAITFIIGITVANWIAIKGMKMKEVKEE